MSVTDETIRSGGRTATILRTPNVSTYMVAEQSGMSSGKRRADPLSDFEETFWLPTTSAIVSGEMILSKGEYFLVMSAEKKYLGDDLEYYRGMLYKCNSIITIYSFNTTTKKHDTVVASSVRCLITQVYSKGQPDDKALLGIGYNGRQTPFQLYAQDDCGITIDGNVIVVDQDGRRFRISKESDPFIAAGILQTQVMWER